MAVPPVAVTGASGFIGRRLVETLVARGLAVRALARRPDAQLASAGVELVPGGLGDPGALRSLVVGARAVIQCAGVDAAADPAEFRRVNVDGTIALLAALPAGTPLVQVSSLSAREPRLSAYAASKQVSEAMALARRDGPVAVVRPPAVYGPGDRATLPLFQQMAKGFLVTPAPASARFSLVYVADLAALLADLVLAPPRSGSVIEPSDRRPGGYGWQDLASIAGEAQGRPVRLVRLPAGALRPVALAIETAAGWRGKVPMLSRDKLRELCHADWVCRDDGHEALAAARASVQFREGFTETVAWYRRRGWL
jgi:nucleoside-diphosphate-sugar epimerase